MWLIGESHITMLCPKYKEDWEREYLTFSLLIVKLGLVIALHNKTDNVGKSSLDILRYSETGWPKLMTNICFYQFVDYLIYFVGHASRINFYIVWIREHTTIYISVAWSLLFSSSNMMCLLNVKIKVFLNFRKTCLKYVLIYFILIPFAVYFSSGTPIMHVLSPFCVFSTPIILPLILQNLKKQIVQVFWACHHYCYFFSSLSTLFCFFLMFCLPLTYFPLPLTVWCSNLLFIVSL